MHFGVHSRHFEETLMGVLETALKAERDRAATHGGSRRGREGGRPARKGKRDTVSPLENGEARFSAEKLREFVIPSEMPDESNTAAAVDPERAAVQQGLQDALAAVRNGDRMDDIREDIDRIQRTLDGFYAGPLKRYTIGGLQEQWPNRRQPVVDGLFRELDTVNVISSSKIGKSWMLYGLAFSIATGQMWLGRFPTRQGKCLIVDNELHGDCLAFRLKAVADAMGIPWDSVKNDIEVMVLRGKGIDVYGIGRYLEKTIKPGEFRFIAVDAKYRALPLGTSENDNESETALYNETDRLTGVLQSTFGYVHHSTKGSQTEKRVTDVGAGGGAQSRATDCHIVIREHEETDAYVLAAAVRSFAPVKPLGLRFEFPLWVPDDSIDPTQLKGKQTRGEERQSEEDQKSDGMILDQCRTWRSRTELKRLLGWAETKRDRAIRRLLDAGYLEQSTEQRPGRKEPTEVFRKTIHAR
jgi:hypothetical protein